MICRKSHCQEYECCVVHNGISFDACLAKELFWLWDMGIETVGSCCGKHINSDKNVASYIQVKDEYIDKMKELGYIEDKNYKHNPCNSFKPKLNL